MQPALQIRLDRHTDGMRLLGLHEDAECRVAELVSASEAGNVVHGLALARVYTHLDECARGCCL